MKFEVTILGCGAATPTLRRNPSSQLVNLHDKFFLVDCGEGTQIQLRKYKLKFQKINHIFISHLHGDHYLGLLGLISSMHLLGRTKPIRIYGPKALEEIVIINLKHSETYLNFNIDFVHTQDDKKQLLFEDNTLEVYSFPLKHRIPCTGFLFEEKVKKRKIIKSKIEQYNLSLEEIGKLKAGYDLQRENGAQLLNVDFTVAPEAPRKYAYCSDTSYFEAMIDSIEGAQVIYHEATFTEELKKRAKETFHSTASQAAMIASKANAKRLILGHYSSRYTDLEQFRVEAEANFGNVELARDGMTLTL